MPAPLQCLLSLCRHEVLLLGPDHKKKDRSQVQLPWLPWLWGGKRYIPMATHRGRARIVPLQIPACRRWIYTHESGQWTHASPARSSVFRPGSKIDRRYSRSLVPPRPTTPARLASTETLGWAGLAAQTSIRSYPRAGLPKQRHSGSPSRDDGRPSYCKVKSLRRLVQ